MRVAASKRRGDSRVGNWWKLESKQDCVEHAGKCLQVAMQRQLAQAESAAALPICLCTDARCGLQLRLHVQSVMRHAATGCAELVLALRVAAQQ